MRWGRDEGERRKWEQKPEELILGKGIANEAVVFKPALCGMIQGSYCLTFIDLNYILKNLEICIYIMGNFSEAHWFYWKIRFNSLTFLSILTAVRNITGSRTPAGGDTALKTFQASCGFPSLFHRSELGTASTPSLRVATQPALISPTIPFMFPKYDAMWNVVFLVLEAKKHEMEQGLKAAFAWRRGSQFFTWAKLR